MGCIQVSVSPHWRLKGLQRRLNGVLEGVLSRFHLAPANFTKYVRGIHAVKVARAPGQRGTGRLDITWRGG